MIKYKFHQEKAVFLYFAELLDNQKALDLIEQGEVSSCEDARYLSQFYWQAVEKSAEIKHNNEPWPFENGGEYWLEKLYNSIGGYMERAGYEEIWDDEIDNA